MNGDSTKEIQNFSKDELLSVLKKSTNINDCELIILEMNQKNSNCGGTSQKESISKYSNFFNVVIGIYTKEQDKIVYEKKKEILLNDFEINSILFDEEKYRKIIMKKSENPQKYIDNLVDYLKFNKVPNYDIFEKVDVLIDSCMDINPVQKTVKTEEEKPIESVYSKYLTMQNGIPFSKIS